MIIYPIVDGAYAIAAKVVNNKRVWKPHPLSYWRGRDRHIRFGRQRWRPRAPLILCLSLFACCVGRWT
ncbi:unnamed protein product [Scytosiphon promiscuus]